MDKITLKIANERITQIVFDAMIQQIIRLDNELDARDEPTPEPHLLVKRFAELEVENQRLKSAAKPAPSVGRPLPPGIPKPPEGYAYAGMGRIENELATYGKRLQSDRWTLHMICGNVPDAHYALPIDSPHFDMFDAPEYPAVHAPETEIDTLRRLLTRYAPEWTDEGKVHLPGDPMPCKPEVMIEVEGRDGIWLKPRLAKFSAWGLTHRWRRCTRPQIGGAK